MPQVDPKQRSFVELFERGGVEQPRIGAIRALPTAVGHRNAIGGGNVLRKQVPGARFQRGVGQDAKAANACHQVQPPPPLAKIVRTLVVKRLDDDLLEFLRRGGRQTPHGQLRRLIVVQIAVPVVGGDRRLRAPKNVDLRLGIMHRHSPGHAGRECRRRHRIAYQHHETQPPLLGHAADLQPDVLGVARVRHHGQIVALTHAVLQPGLQRATELGRTNHDRIWGPPGAPPATTATVRRS